MFTHHELPTLGHAVVATSAAYSLGEGPAWDPVRQQVMWVDIDARTAYRGALHSDGSIAVVVEREIPAGACAIAAALDGSLVIAGRDRLTYWGLDGALTESHQLVRGKNRRLNDGKPDPAGRFVVGTMSQPDARSREQLLRVEQDGGITVIDDDVTLSNGLAWSPGGDVLYHVDTLARRIYARDYDSSTREYGRRTTLIDLSTQFPGCYPDGMTVDAQGCLWVAMWGGGCVVQFSAHGLPLAALELPAPFVTSVAFAGKDLEVLVVTTATAGMSADDRLTYPLAGRLFTADVGSAGAGTPMWSGHQFGLDRTERSSLGKEMSR